MQKRDVEQLITKLKDPDKDVRKNAIAGLGEIGDERAILPLMASLEDDELFVKWAAEEALARFKSYGLELGPLSHSQIAPKPYTSDSSLLKSAFSKLSFILSISSETICILGKLTFGT